MRLRTGQISLLLLIAALVAWWSLFPTPVRAEEKDAGPPPTRADMERLEKRIRDLEEVIRRMDGERARPGNISVSAVTPSPLKDANEVGSAVTPATVPEAGGAAPPRGSVPREAPAASPGAVDIPSAYDGGLSSILAGWDDGFYLRSRDRDFNLRITGQIQADYRAYLDGTDYTDIDTFLLRRARLGIEADMFRYYEFRLLPDFGQNQPTIQDAYLNVHYWDFFQVEAGKFKQPFSYEQLIQDRFVPTLERSLFDQLVPARDEGVMIHGQKLLGNRVDYYFSVSNGEINGNGDTNKLKDLAGRVVVRPFNSERWDLLHGLQLGVAATTGVEQEPINPNTLKTPLGVQYFQYNSTVRADGLRTRWSPELSYFYGSLGVAAQYFHEDQDMRPSFVGPTFRFLVDVPMDGYYVLVTYLLTGEERTTYSQAVTPLRPFDPSQPFSCPGAWELVARVSRLKLGDVVFAPGPARLADPTRFANDAIEMTFGFNWYLNKWVRTQFNWEHAWFDQNVRLGPGPGGLLGHQDTLGARFQIIF
jgi:phosphate-selective porin OprO/OprP